MSAELRAPFPWFGGKRRVADVVWRAFGRDVPNYIEPFAGSLAVLLGRPGGAGKIETVNDRDRYLANFWRAVTLEPELVAQHADWPVNEADLHARHKWLVNQAEFRDRMHQDPDFYDVKVAGWWVWGLCQWIGGGWCVEPKAGHEPKVRSTGLPQLTVYGHGDGASGTGVHAGGLLREAERKARSRGADRVNEANRPELAGAGKGVHSSSNHRKRPELDGTSPGRGVHSDSAHEPKRQIPMLSVGTDGGLGAGGRGVHGKLPATWLSGVHSSNIGPTGPINPFERKGTHLPALGNDRGLNGVSAAPCLDWFLALQARLRRVRVACGDWKRVLGDSVLGKGKNVGGRRPCAVFLDPPYSFEFRDPYLYSEDDAAISAQVREWALEHGDDPDLRIALCGYAGEHEMPATWTEHAWKGARGYASEANNNRERERIWFSPHCLPLEAQRSLFG